MSSSSWKQRMGQMFTSDFVLSAFIFIMILNLSFMLWNEAYAQQDQLSEERILQQQASYAVNLLVRTPGYPENWDAGSVEILGLAEPDHVLQEAKLDELDSMSENEIQSALSVESEFFINVTNQTRTLEIGGDPLRWGTPPTDADTVVVARRPVTVNATNLYQRGTVKLQLWQ